MSIPLTSGQRSLLENLQRMGTAKASTFHEDDLKPLIERQYVRRLNAGYVGITALGNQVLLPGDQQDALDRADKRAEKLGRTATAFVPLSDSQRSLLVLLSLKGKLPPKAFDGRTANALQAKGLVKYAEDGSLAITPSGAARVSRSDPPTPETPRKVLPAAPPLRAVKPLAPAPLLDSPKPLPKAPVVDIHRDVPPGNIIIAVIPEGLDEAHMKARILDALMASSPTIKKFYETVRAAEQAAGQVKGG